MTHLNTLFLNLRGQSPPTTDTPESRARAIVDAAAKARGEIKDDSPIRAGPIIVGTVDPTAEAALIVAAGQKRRGEGP
jgi:hypothetical protein